MIVSKIDSSVITTSTITVPVAQAVQIQPIQTVSIPVQTVKNTPLYSQIANLATQQSTVKPGSTLISFEVTTNSMQNVFISTTKNPDNTYVYSQYIQNPVTK